jgi:prepilin-type N-terminal cleavage/methylation domain-containing protein
MVSPRHAGMSMIELIFAIVLIAIVVAAVPQMVTENQKGTEGYVKQEVIAAAAGEAFRVMSYPWDANSVSAGSNRSHILDGTVSSNLKRVGTLPLRKGDMPPLTSASNPDRHYHRQFFPSTTNPSGKTLPGAKAGVLLGVTGATKYKNTYSVTLASNGYIPDGNPSGATSSTLTYNFPSAETVGIIRNMKMVSVQIDSPGENNIVTFRVYAANIGTAEYYTREFK